MSVIKRPKLTVDAINVGHGDCTLISWDNGDANEPWHCIIDSGDGQNKHDQQIFHTLKSRNITKIDLAIVSHFDTDHINGFNKVCENIEIKEYWSPYTPAFMKYTWLFGERGKAAVERASKLERKLAKKNIAILSPLDGYVVSPVEGLRISVFSPPVKLYEKLLSGNKVDELFETYPTPIGTVLKDDTNYMAEGYVNNMLLGFHNRLNRGIIERNLDQEAQELNDLPTEKFSIDKLLIQKKQEVGPEFFGNHVLNDTSLVIKFEVWTGTRWFSLLFPGDLENWVYLMSRYQTFLYSDYYKVSHHGGRVFIDGNEAADAVIQAIRPSVAAISANGRHNLPRTSVREALIRWSSSLLCSLNRGCEKFRLDGMLPQETKSCQEMYSCQERQGNLRLEVTGDEMETNVQACQRVYTPNRLPVITFEQHFVPNSKVLTTLSVRETEKHALFIQKELKSIHRERTKEIWGDKSGLVSIDEIQTRLREGERHLTKKQIQEVYKYGYINKKFWAKEVREYALISSWEKAYLLPTKKDIEMIIKLICTKDLLLVPVDEFISGLSSLLLKIHREAICKYLEKITMFPKDLISDYIWPFIIKEIIENYDVIYIKSNNYYSNDKWLIMYRKGMGDFREFIKLEYEKILLLEKTSTIDSCLFKSYFDKYLKGGEKIQILSNHSNDSSKRHLSNELRSMFRQSGNKYSCDYNITILNK